MIRIIDVVLGAGRAATAAGTEEDPFREDDVLAEAQVLGVIGLPGADAAALLLDLRTALQLDEGNTGLLVARGGALIDVDGSGIGVPPRALPIMTSSTVQAQQRAVIRLETHPGGSFAIGGAQLAFHVLGVPSIPDVPPDYTEPGWSWTTVHLPQWNSGCELLTTALFPE